MTSSKPIFDKVPSAVSFPAIEEQILKLWQRLDAFQESNRRRQPGGAGDQGKGEFVFYDGPPFATGTPHYGHLLAGTIKDIVPRYWNMRGHHVDRRFGWDCHGLPIENLAQQALGLKGTPDINRIGVAAFNEQCRSLVQKYVAEWRATITRMGRWVDFDRDYKTMDRDFMESVWWVFKQLWDQKRIYKAHRIMPYDPVLTTPLSNFEAGNNYKDVQDPAVTVKFRVTEHDLAFLKPEDADKPIYLLAWTTTPWTLPENLALCVSPGIPYKVMPAPNEHAFYVLAPNTSVMKSLWKKDAPKASSDPKHPTIEEGPEKLAIFSVGADQLKNWKYEPLFPYFADSQNAFRILSDEFVTTGEGTGIVHMAPAYGEDDYRVCRAAGIGLVDPLDNEAKFTAAIPEYAGQFCKDADKAIIKRLKDEGKLVHQSTIVHSYPFGERTDAPLIYRAIEA